MCFVVGFRGAPVVIDLDALNTDTEAWLRDPIAVNEHLRAQIEVARHDPYFYTDLALAFEHEAGMTPHAMHTLIHDAIAAARSSHKHLLIVAPPGSAKSKRAIKDACIWSLAKNPSTYTSLISYAEDVCKRNLIWCRKTLASPLTRELWPHLVPDAGQSLAGGGWSTERLYLRGHHDPCFDAHTVLSDRGGITPNQLFGDDIITQAVKDEEPARRKIFERLHGSWIPRLRGADAFALLLGNCWHRDDAYHRMLREEFAGKWFVLWMGYEGYERIYWRTHHTPSTWPHEEAGFLPLWDTNPNCTASALRTIESATYKRLYEQRATLVEEMRFPPVERWKTWEPADIERHLSAGAMIYAGEDVSGGISLNKNDYAALAGVLVDQEMNMYLLDFWCARAKVTDQIRACWHMHERIWRRWGRGIDRLVVEALKNNQEWFRLAMQAAQDALRKDGNLLWDLDWSFWTPPHSKSKNVLIDSMTRHFEVGTLLFPPNILELAKTDDSWRQLKNQTEDFPPPPSSKTDHDDAPNALAIAVDEARRLGPGLTRQSMEYKQRLIEAQREIVVSHPLTGAPMVKPMIRKMGI